MKFRRVKGRLVQTMPVCVRGHLEKTVCLNGNEDLKWSVSPSRENTPPMK